MKKLYSGFPALLLFFSMARAVAPQAPQKFNYQAVARSAAGNLLTNTLITLRFTVHDSLATGNVLYRETDDVTTNQFGLFSMQIGGGDVLAGNFSNINWGSGDKYLEVEMSTDGGSTFSNLGTSQLVSVPFALYAQSSGSGNISADSCYEKIHTDTIVSCAGQPLSISAGNDNATLNATFNQYVNGAFYPFKVQLNGTVISHKGSKPGQSVSIALIEPFSYDTTVNLGSGPQTIQIYDSTASIIMSAIDSASGLVDINVLSPFRGHNERREFPNGDEATWHMSGIKDAQSQIGFYLGLAVDSTCSNPSQGNSNFGIDLSDINRHPTITVMNQSDRAYTLPTDTGQNGYYLQVNPTPNRAAEWVPLTVPLGTAEPSRAVKGQLFFNTRNNKLEIWTGASWVYE